MLRPRFPAAVLIDRGFRRLAHGDVHYRAGGAGPMLLALHESPRSSLSMQPVIEALSGRFRVVAPDTPGYGLSYALPGEHPSLDDFVDALAQLLDSFGVRRIPIYGAHTGAALALAFAHRHRDRVSGLVLDGVSAFSDDEIAAFRTRYLEPYRPSWDGGHVMKLWSRVRDLYTWFPWYDQAEAARLASDPSALSALDRSVLGFVQAGGDYAKAYVHAAAFDPNAVLGSLSVPVTIMAKPDDLIASHLDRLTLGPTCRLIRLGSAPGDWRDALEDATAGLAADAARPTADATEGSCFVSLGEGWLHAVRAGPVDGPLRLLLPGLPGDIVDLLKRERRAHPQMRLLALSPPGCGWSDPLACEVGVGEVGEALRSALQSSGAAPRSACAAGASVVLARALAAACDWPFGVEEVDAPGWAAPGNELPHGDLLRPLPSRWDGAHLTSAWFQVRDLQMYDIPPGCGPVARRVAPPPSAEALDRLFRNSVEGPDCAALLAAIVGHLRQAQALWL